MKYLNSYSNYIPTNQLVPTTYLPKCLRNSSKHCTLPHLAFEPVYFQWSSSQHVENIFHSSNPQPCSWSLLKSHRSSLSLYRMVCCCVIPLSLQKDTLEKIQEGHQGITCCWMWAKISVWWPGISATSRRWLHLCSWCRATERALDPQPDYPWQMAGTDLLGKDHYVLVVDYFSRYTKSSSYLLPLCPPLFLHWRQSLPNMGYPIVQSDNSPQYSSGDSSLRPMDSTMLISP